jgi:hypothetical protein
MSGTVVGIELAGVNAIAKWREIIGPTKKDLHSSRRQIHFARCMRGARQRTFAISPMPQSVPLARSTSFSANLEKIKTHSLFQAEGITLWECRPPRRSDCLKEG